MTPSDFNLRHLRVLGETVRRGSFSAAADALGISQPAVTQAIGRMEALTGTKLIERTPARAVPTDAGVLLAARGEAAAAALADAFRPQRKGGIGGRASADQDITMAQLTALIGFADSGSYAAGAAMLGMSQPSLHRSVAELERLSGLALVERRGRGAVLTEAGARLTGAFRLALAELKAALDELAVLSGRDQGTVRIGAHGAALIRLIPAAAARFLAEHPPVVIHIEEVGAASGAEALASGRLDALVTLGDPAFGRSGFLAEPIADDPLVVAARTGHPLADGAAPGLVRMAGFGWAVSPQGSAERSVWEKLFLDGGLYPPTPSFTCPSLPALLDLVARGDLLTVAPLALVERGRERLTAIGGPLPGGRRIVLVTRSGWAPTPAQATFLDELRSAAAEPVAF